MDKRFHTSLTITSTNICFNGCDGSTLCLLVATFLVSRNAASKNVAKLSLDLDSSSMEPVLFGYPIVITAVIPFILAPALGI